ncbi:Nuclear pore protein [Aspergillus sclerotialis]|uniref:Nuclear pore protein n=1 Tax=Aspergillus sclerotialis TaxID=2070753 RepID=A0A3A2ZM33_9EURO|nr:Nuclear pore protein [Aspergillus sclerotialis]
MASSGSSSLFGGANLGTTAASQSTSAFPASNPSSIFGNPPPTQTSTGSLFGSQSQTQQQQPAQSSIFGQTLDQTKSGQEPARPAGQATQPAYFNSLLERGKKRPLSEAGQSSGFEDLPNLQLGLDDIRRKARELGAGGANDSPRNGVNTKAHYLLAASGIPAGRALRDLKALDPHASIGTPTKDQDDFDPDNQKFLRSLQHRGRQVMIAEGLARTHRDFDMFLENKVNMDWEAQRKKIFQHFGLAQKDEQVGDAFGATQRGSFGRSAKQSRHLGATSPHGPSTPSRRSVFGKSGLEKSVIGTPGAGLAFSQLAENQAERGDGPVLSTPDFRFLQEKMGHYAEKVQFLNSARLQAQSYPILHEFSEVEKHAGGDIPPQLFDAYRALVNIVQENHDSTNPSDHGVVRERQFCEDYLDEAPNSRRAMNLRKRIIEGSRSFLERSFYDEVETAITRNPREAQLGGIPTVINKIRAYIRLRATRKDLAPDATELQLVGQDYCWILIFYLLRCGFVTEAAEYVSQDPGFRSLDHKFVTYMTTYAQNRRLPRDLQQKINGEYQQRSRNAPDNTVDPYRMACYKIIGCCDLSRRRLEGVSQSVDDWMWLQFTLAREDDRAEEIAGDIFGLEDIQTDITEIGQRVFGKGQEGPASYGSFFLLQILGGMFEQAIAYLSSYAPVSAVHFAIALAYYGLLRVSDFYTSGEEILSFTVKQYPQINFGYLITQYTREFRTGYVEPAVNYFCLLCLNADLPGSLGKSQACVCHEALREFILETRDFAKLLGDIRADGTRIKGIIEQRLDLIKLVDQEEFLRTITVQAAAVADDKGLITDAVLLYHLAEDYDRVIEAISRALSDAVSVELGGSALRLQPLRPRTDQSKSGLHLDQERPEPGSSLSLTAVEDPVILAKNMIGLYNTNALYYQQIRQVNRDTCGLLLRMMEAKVEVESGRWTPALDAINELVSRNVGHVIMWSITCIGHERERLNSGVYENEIKQGLADELLIMAKDLMIFSGMVKYKLPPRVYDTLARAGADIGAY